MIKSLSILTTYHCNASCDCCDCGPHVRVQLSDEDLIHYIDEAVSIGTIALVVFTGGEPTLLGEGLFKAIKHATKYGLLTRIVTNGWWARSEEAALEFIDKLKDHGLTEMNISVDDLHQQWIPIERVKHAFMACQKRQFPCLIAHKAMLDYKITKEYLEDYFGVELITFESGKKYKPSEECRLISSGRVVPIGRNASDVRKENIAYSSHQGNCSSVLNDIVVGANHQLLPCCGIVSKDIPELNLGDLRKHAMIDLIDAANRDLIINWIALEGPSSIAKFVKEKDPSIQFDDQYVGICHLCNEVLTREDVRSVLSAHIDEVIDRISFHRSFFESIRKDEELTKLYCEN